MPIDIPMRYESEPLLWSVDAIYTASACYGFIELIERSSPTLATNNPLYRDQDRVIKDDPEIAGELFSRLRPHLPEQMGLEVYVFDTDAHQLAHTYRRKEEHLEHDLMLEVAAFLNDTKELS